MARHVTKQLILHNSQNAPTGCGVDHLQAITTVMFKFGKCWLERPKNRSNFPYICESTENENTNNLKQGKLIYKDTKENLISIFQINAIRNK